MLLLTVDWLPASDILRQLATVLVVHVVLLALMCFRSDARLAGKSLFQLAFFHFLTVLILYTMAHIFVAVVGHFVVVIMNKRMVKSTMADDIFNKSRKWISGDDVGGCIRSEFCFWSAAEID
ncbi:hypothetical protein T4A_7271 [Trichinella pseudospiralis]|uniref:Uncharacterized protein n=1 Tax=Trichinella pseudospiralis TaxID=6337 RepID=A0A0V1E1D0_TRIPS|nr:hypothetical protein T4A_7271 [Trichinella pseudospiralis]